MDNETLTIAMKLMAVIGLVAANGFFVATEFSLVSVRRSRIESLVAEGHSRAAGVLSALKDLDGYIAASSSASRSPASASRGSTTSSKT
ncbi:MAG: CNNM domain-containing protein [Chloroflexota bacterium]